MQLAGDGDLSAKLRRDEARLCLNISKMEERLQRLAPDPGLVEEVERLAVERTVREADVILSCLSSPLERYLHPASVCCSVAGTGRVRHRDCQGYQSDRPQSQLRSVSLLQVGLHLPSSQDRPDRIMKQ